MGGTRKCGVWSSGRDWIPGYFYENWMVRGVYEYENDIMPFSRSFRRFVSWR